MPEEPSATKQRIIFIDALRGYAILMMLQGHTVGVVLDDTLRDKSLPVYRAWHYMTGLTAPTFFFAAGLIFTYLLMREENPSSRIQKGWRRGLWLIFLGFFLQIYLTHFIQALAGNRVDHNYLHFLTHSHVLQAIGLALLALVTLHSLSRATRIPLLVLTLVAANAAFIFCPFTKLYESDGWAGFLLELFFSKERSVFPLFPWLGHTLFGCAAGIVTARWRWYENWQALGVLFIAGMIVSQVLAWPLLYNCYAPFTDNPGPWLKLSIGTYYRLGEVLMLTALVAGLCKIITMPRFLLAAGRETLTIYFLHVIVIYGGIFGLGLPKVISRELGGWQTAGLALLVVIAFAILAMALPSLRKKYQWLELLR